MTITNHTCRGGIERVEGGNRSRSLQVLEEANNNVDENQSGKNTTFHPGFDGETGSEGEDEDHGHGIDNLGNEDLQRLYPLVLSEVIGAVLSLSVGNFAGGQTVLRVGAELLYDFFGSQRMGRGSQGPIGLLRHGCLVCHGDDGELEASLSQRGWCDDVVGQRPEGGREKERGSRA